MGKALENLNPEMKCVHYAAVIALATPGPVLVSASIPAAHKDAAGHILTASKAVLKASGGPAYIRRDGAAAEDGGYPIADGEEYPLFGDLARASIFVPTGTTVHIEFYA